MWGVDKRFVLAVQRDVCWDGEAERVLGACMRHMEVRLRFRGLPGGSETEKVKEVSRCKVEGGGHCEKGIPGKRVTKAWR